MIIDLREIKTLWINLDSANKNAEEITEQCKNYKIDNNQELVVLLETDDSITLHQFILFQIILIILIHHSLIPHFQ